MPMSERMVFYAAARVDDVLDDNDMASPWTAPGAVVRGQLDERDLTGEIDMLEHDRPYT